MSLIRLKNRKAAGTSLIEILVVIVVFLVGILAVVQIFPPGFSILRATRKNSVATELAKSEINRLKGQSEQVAEQFVAVDYQWTTSGLRIVRDPNRLPADLMPRGSGIDQQGIVLDDLSRPLDYWPRMSAANCWNRVIGEGRKVPTPRFLGANNASVYGCLMPLQFSPVYYQAGVAGLVEVYGNDYIRRWGQPNPWRIRDYSFNFVNDDDTEAGFPFQGEDQIWIPVVANRRYRISFSFTYNTGSERKQYDIVQVVQLDPADPGIGGFAQPVGNYWVVSLNQLVGLPDEYSRVLYDPNNVEEIMYDSVSVQRVFNEVAPGAAFTNDPYEYKMLSGQFGFVLINPTAFNFTINKPRGREKLQARVDYTAYDWRLIHDEFRIPTALPYQQRLILNNLMAMRKVGADGLQFTGLGVQTPNGVGGMVNTDFLLIDVETGGVFMPNTYKVDYSAGVLTFVDLDNNQANNRLASRVIFPVDNANPWSGPVINIDDVRGRSVRALYMATNEWCAHVMKAPQRYRETGINVAATLQTGEYFVGGQLDINGVPIGRPTRIYFPKGAVDQKVIVGEIHYVDAGNNLVTLNEQEFTVRGGVDALGLPFIELLDIDPNAVSFDYRYGYAVRRVRGASLEVRVMWNPASFRLGNNPAANMQELEKWMRNWRQTRTETFLVTGQQ